MMSLLMRGGGPGGGDPHHLRLLLIFTMQNGPTSDIFHLASRDKAVSANNLNFKKDSSDLIRFFFFRYLHGRLAQQITGEVRL